MKALRKIALLNFNASKITDVGDETELASGKSDPWKVRAKAIL